MTNAASHSSLTTLLNEVEQYRLRVRKRSATAILITIGLVAAAVLLFVAIRQPVLSGLLGLAAILVFILGHAQPVKKFKALFKQKIITAIIQDINPELSYSPRGKVDKSAFAHSKIFTQRSDRYTGEDFISGRIGSTDMQMSELHCQYRTTDHKGRTQYHTFFKGLFMIADFHKHFNGRTVVLPDKNEKLFGGFGKWLQKMNFGRDQLIYMEDPDFEENFVVYGTDQVEARYILSTSMNRRILDLKQKLGAKVYLSFVDSNVHVAIAWKKNLLEPSLRKSLTESNAVGEFREELQLCLGIVDDLNLNTRIWSKQDHQQNTPE